MLAERANINRAFTSELTGTVGRVGIEKVSSGIVNKMLKSHAKKGMSIFLSVIYEAAGSSVANFVLRIGIPNAKRIMVRTD